MSRRTKSEEQRNDDSNGEKQIPFGDDNQKSNSKNKCERKCGVFLHSAARKHEAASVEITISG
jgi:hypothetical protein